MNTNKKILSAALIIVGAVAIFPIASYAQNTAQSNLTQSVTAGALSTSIRSASGGIVSSPSFAMSSVQASTGQQTSTGTFGSSDQRITVDNPGGANNGWNLSWQATTPGTATWTSGSNTYAYNGAPATGQLTVNPSAGTITAVTGGTSGVSLSSSAAFSGTSPLSLIVASAASADIWNGYVTGIGLSQTIPAGTPVGNYTISMTQTVNTAS